MTLDPTPERMRLAGHVSAEDAEPLAAWLLAHPGAPVELADDATLHGAALQVLLALRPPLAHPPAERWLAAALVPAAPAAAPLE
jgi:hypothetical protein